MHKMSRTVAKIFLVAGIALNAASASDIGVFRDSPSVASESRICRNQIRGELFSRTELFFGLSRAGGPDVTEAEFQHFVDSEVTPRFPDGLTLLGGKGQFKDSTGTVVREGAKLLVLLYRFDQESNRAVEEIRDEYKRDFQQESVLRVDEQTCVSF